MGYKARGQAVRQVEVSGVSVRHAVNLYIEAHGSLPDTVVPDDDTLSEYYEILGRCEGCGLAVMMGDDEVSDPNGTMRHLICISADD